jgi:sugar/nucleoside kinase (ribokinase family)
VSLLIVGSIGIDDILTPAGSARNTLGGSASYAAVAASFLSPVRLVGIVGSDFPRRFLNLFRRRGIDLLGLEIVPGARTFRWTGRYHENFSSRETVEIHLNVFEAFNPRLPAAYASSPYVFLANISPRLQLSVLDQVRSPRFVAADTMDLWIRTDPSRVRALIRRVDLILMNDEEAVLFTGERNLVAAGRALLSAGARAAVIKKGAHGALLFPGPGMPLFQVPAVPLARVVDPTGAGDSFAGAFMGHLASRRSTAPPALRSAMAMGSVMASFTVEDFSLGKLARQSSAALRRRHRGYLGTFRL